MPPRTLYVPVGHASQARVPFGSPGSLLVGSLGSKYCNKERRREERVSGPSRPDASFVGGADVGAPKSSVVLTQGLPFPPDVVQYLYVFCVLY